MNENNDLFHNGMSDLDGFLGGYDSSSDGKSRGYNYGSTYNFGSSTGKNDFNNHDPSDIGSGYSSLNYDNSINQSGSSQTGANNYQNQYNGRDEYVPVLNNYEPLSSNNMNSPYSSTESFSQNSSTNNPGIRNIDQGGMDSSVKNDSKSNTAISALIAFLPAIMFLIPLFIIFGPTLKYCFHYLDLANNGESVTAYATNVSEKDGAKLYFTYKGTNYVDNLKGQYKEGESITVYVDPDNPKDFVRDGEITDSIPALCVLALFTLLVVMAAITNFLKLKSGKGRIRRGAHGRIGIS